MLYQLHQLALRAQLWRHSPVSHCRRVCQLEPQMAQLGYLLVMAEATMTVLLLPLPGTTKMPHPAHTLLIFFFASPHDLLYSNPSSMNASTMSLPDAPGMASMTISQPSTASSTGGGSGGSGSGSGGGGGGDPSTRAAEVRRQWQNLWAPVLATGELDSPRSLRLMFLLDQIDPDVRRMLWLQCATSAAAPVPGSAAFASAPSNAAYYHALVAAEPPKAGEPSAPDGKPSDPPSGGGGGGDSKTAPHPLLVTSIDEIDRDIGRTLPEILSSSEQHGALRRILVAYVVRNPMQGYAQGMNVLAGVLLYGTRSEESAFELLCWLLENDRNICDYYDRQLSGLHVDLAVLDEVLAKSQPALSTHMRSLGLDNTWFLSNILMSACVNSVPVGVWSRVWDLVFLIGHAPAVLGTALAFFAGSSSALMACPDSGSAMACLATQLHKWQTGDVDGAGGGRPAVFFESLLAGAALVGPTTLQQLRAKHRPAVLGRLAAQDADDAANSAARAAGGAGAAAGDGEDKAATRSTPRPLSLADIGRKSWLSQTLWLQRSVQWVSRMLTDIEVCR